MSVLWNYVFNGGNGTLPDPVYFTPVLGDGRQYGLYGWGNGDFQVFTSNATLQDGNGNLVIHLNSSTDTSLKTNCSPTITNTTQSPFLNVGPAAYTSGKISTQDKLEFLYGSIEAQIKLPPGTNTDFAFCMLSSKYPNLVLPFSGEIDIVKQIKTQTQLTFGTYSNGEPSNNYIKNPFDNSTTVDTSSIQGYNQGDFNIYRIDWDPSGIKWFVNGSQFWSIDKSTYQNYDYPFDRPFYLMYQNASNVASQNFSDNKSYMKYIKYSTYNGYGSLTSQTNQLGSPWSHLRGMYSTNTALSPYHGPTTTPLLSWQYTANNIILSSASIDASGNIYFGCDDGYLYSLTSTGGLRWKTLIDGNGLIRTAPCIGPTGNVYAGSLKLNNDYSVNVNYPGKIACISTDGDVIATSTWASSIFSSPILGISGTNGGQGSLIITTCDGYLRALNPTTLEQRWFSQINTGVIFSSPTIGSDGTIYIGSYDNKIYAFPASPVNQILTSTSPLWTYQCESSIYTTPAINNNILYVSDNLGNLYAFQTVNSNVSTAGELLWIFTPNLSPTPVSSFGSPTCGTDGTVFYTVYQDNRTLLFAVSSKGINGNPYTPYVIIPNATLSQCSPFVGADGTIYIIDTNSIIYAFTYNSSTGIFTLLFTYNIIGNQVYGAMSLSMDANGVLYIGGANRQMVALKPN